MKELLDKLTRLSQEICFPIKLIYDLDCHQTFDTSHPLLKAFLFFFFYNKSNILYQIINGNMTIPLMNCSKQFITLHYFMTFTIRCN